ncbi:pyridoxal-phosphate dependent enzyme [Rhodohalobacter sulfatireducens]|uniref:Pyridoxal-phosphate dependent enzyme n=1 Tax=Rhodohalobacter sulfatireducens TaxID=2911366 RepID=A0ABS9KD37_9BACT|nr:pyridoxal-phosphate dependent enzyme [Rhodohalobacter sulfatireducens]MCG2588760.1 pyridoxal-phosphate dependent enzyme [Rhodohalobacter sulfatireducens]
MSDIPTYSDIKEAAKRIQGFAHKTPVLQSSFFNQRTGAELFFKCENFQKVGAFKFRGAFNAISQLTEDDGKKGIITHSSGNHAQAVALASKMNGYKATIVMPENAPIVKVNAVRDYGAEIVFCESTIESRQESTDQIISTTGATFIHPYNNADVIAGQGTSAKELLEEVPDLDIIIAPIGGGGLMSGTAIASKSIKPDIKVLGAEPKLADDAYRSFQAGSIQPVLRTDTIADGLRTSLGSLTFQIIKDNVDDIVTVTEESIVRDMRRVWERMKIIIEPSCAVPISALLDGEVDISGKKVGIILTGGNVDLENLPWK